MTPTCVCDEGYVATGSFDDEGMRLTTCLQPMDPVPSDFYDGRLPNSPLGLIGREVDVPDSPSATTGTTGSAGSGGTSSSNGTTSGANGSTASGSGGGGCSVSGENPSRGTLLFGLLAGLALWRRRRPAH
jgi:MYXO-CTERM domain-containing protein